MSDVSDAARVQVLLADYAVGDASNKINALGVGFQISVLQPTGFTAPQTVVVLADFPASFAGSETAFELGLYDESGQAVQAPALMGDEGSRVRFGQNVVLQPSVLAMTGLRVPREAVWCRHQVVANFQNGVPVPVGQGYEWQVRLDGETRPDWVARFYVPGPAGGLVVG